MGGPDGSAFIDWPRWIWTLQPGDRPLQIAIILRELRKLSRDVSWSHRTAVARAARSFLAASPNLVRKSIPPLWAYSNASRSPRFAPR